MTNICKLGMILPILQMRKPRPSMKRNTKQRAHLQNDFCVPGTIQRSTNLVFAVS
jgi:hypothetical protein